MALDFVQGEGAVFATAPAEEYFFIHLLSLHVISGVILPAP
jgi:hypothetical protein